jgi:hypothetical protein
MSALGSGFIGGVITPSAHLPKSDEYDSNETYEVVRRSTRHERRPKKSNFISMWELKELTRRIFLPTLGTR